jgi:hypothetical protein
LRPAMGNEGAYYEYEMKLHHLGEKAAERIPFLERLRQVLDFLDTEGVGPKPGRDGLICDLLDIDIYNDFGDRLRERMTAEEMADLLDDMFERYGDRMGNNYYSTTTWIEKARENADRHLSSRYVKEATTGYGDPSVNQRTCQTHENQNDCAR